MTLTTWRSPILAARRRDLDRLGDFLQSPSATPETFEFFAQSLQKRMERMPSEFPASLRAGFRIVIAEAFEEGARRRREHAYRAAGLECSLPELVESLRAEMEAMEERDAA